MKKRFYYLAVFLFVSAVLSAQVSFYNNGILRLAVSGDIVFVNGSFTNTNTASFTNNGQLYVSGDLANDESSMTAGTGVLYLNGSSTQTVSGSQDFKTYDLVTNNSAGITLNNNLSVAGSHTFSNGIITTSATPDYLVYQSGSTYSGSSDSRHVNGWVKKLGSDNFTFPVGSGTFLRPVELINMSGVSEFDVKYHNATPNVTQMQLPVKSVNVYEFWEINKITGGTAAVHMNWDNTKITFLPYLVADIISVYYDGSNWTDQGGVAVGDVTMTGDITSNSVSSFGYFTIGSRSPVPLPLKFLSMTAQRKVSYTDIRWVTAEEINTDHFEVERSDDGISYITLFTMPTANRLQVQEYTYKDFRLVNGIAFYRIRCVDKDGKYRFSKVVAVYERDYLKSKLQVINPVRQDIIIRTKTETGGATVYFLYDAGGRMMLKGNINLVAGTDNIISVGNKLPPGIYYLKLISKGNEYNSKLLIDN